MEDPFHPARVAGTALCALLTACGASTGFADDPTALDAGVAPDTVRPPDAPAPDVSPVAPRCVPFSQQLGALYSEVMLVIDSSGSMREAFGATTRWQTLTAALRDTLPRYDARMSSGLVVFPSRDAVLACQSVVPIALAPRADNVHRVLSELDRGWPSGGTPTWAALHTAGEALRTSSSGTTLTRSLVLATDGGPNCNMGQNQATCRCVNASGMPSDQCVAAEGDCLDDARVIAEISRFAALGIPTYVIGIQAVADSPFAQVLASMARAGGRLAAAGSYYHVDRPEDLSAAFSQIARSITGCSFELPHTAQTLVVTWQGSPMARDTTHRDGWDYTDAARRQITFFGPACEAVSRVRPHAVGGCEAAP